MIGGIVTGSVEPPPGLIGFVGVVEPLDSTDTDEVASEPDTDTPAVASVDGAGIVAHDGDGCADD